MISADTQRILDNITMLRSSYNAWKQSADSNQDEIERYAKLKRDCNDKITELEYQIDQQYLCLRKAMNGELSDIPVESPATVEPVEIGREG